MGCCSSLFDNVPDVPPVIKPDPDITSSVVAVAAALGTFGWSHDYGVWQNERPKSSSDQKKEIWLYLRKRTNKDFHRIQLENFIRNDPKDKSLGKIFYYALVTRVPQVQSFQRIGGQSRHHFSGFHSNNHQSYEDDFYISHPSHVGQHSHHHGAHIVSRTVLITKWQSYGTTTIYDGTMGRGADNLRNQHILLDVLAIGSTVTTYIETNETVEDRDAEGRVVGHHMERRHHRYDDTFVENVQYRVTVNNMLWAEWSVPGDASPAAAGTNVVVVTPFFQTTLEGGWFKRSTFRIQTLNGIDPALAILLSHIVTTEYSIAEIKNDLVLNIPPLPPRTAFNEPTMSLNFSLSTTNGTFNW